MLLEKGRGHYRGRRGGNLGRYFVSCRCFKEVDAAPSEMGLVGMDSA